MKVILYMAITANGFIATLDDRTDFTSKEDWVSYRAIAKRVGNIIYGRRTYDIGIKSNTIPVPDCLNIVVSAKKLNSDKNFIFTTNQPKQILEMLSQKGFKEALVAGGGLLNAHFMKENLVDEIYLDIEPHVFGNGIPLFRPIDDFETKLELLEVKNLSPQTVQLHYKVKRT